MANTKLPARLLDTSEVPNLNISGTGLGIGTTSTNALINLVEDNSRSSKTGTAQGQIHISGGTDLSNGDVSGITFSTNSLAQVSSIIGNTITNSGSSLFFGTSNSYASGVTNTAMLIDPSGNVGIGTTSPGKNLEINDSSAPTIRFGRANSYYWDIGHTLSQFQFNSQTGGTIMQLNFDGNVGIGTTSPDNTLHIHKGTAGSVTGNTNAPLTVENSTSNFLQMLAPDANESGILFGNPTNSANSGIVYSGLNGDLQFRNAGNVERMRIDSNGELLVGTTSSATTGTGFKFIASASSGNQPYMVITVDTSSTHMSNYHHYNQNATYNGYRFYIKNNGGVVNYSANNVNLSDEKVKTNIELSGNYLEKICSIPVKLFNYKDEPEGVARSLGVIAQDVEAVAPELVNNEGFGDTPEDGVPLKTVYTTDMMYALMKAIQELSAKVEELEGKIE